MANLKRSLIFALGLAAFSVLMVNTAPGVKPEIYVKEGGTFLGGWTYALNGYDPVSYFSASGPRQGTDKFIYLWKGALWRFASRENRDKFIARPAAFTPRYGGYCAWAAAHGRLVPADPRVWAIHRGKLYVIRNRSLKRKWDKDREALIAKADAYWPSILN